MFPNGCTEVSICPCCERSMPKVEVRRRNTSYTDETQNWLLSCEECWEEDTKFFQEQWDEYYRSGL